MLINVENLEPSIAKDCQENDVKYATNWKLCLVLEFWLILSRLKLSLCPGGSLRGRGWKYGSGFVDGIFPVLGPLAQQIMEFVREEVDYMGLWDSLDTLPATNSTWDDIISVAVQLRLNKKWGPIILVGI